jgi:hypothetical protein
MKVRRMSFYTCTEGKVSIIPLHWEQSSDGAHSLGVMDRHLLVWIVAELGHDAIG